MPTRELQIPIVLDQNQKAFEILRVWADKTAYVSLRRDVWDDHAMWGILLADIARHVANAHQNENRSSEKILARIKEGFDAEWTTPRGAPKQVN